MLDDKYVVSADVRAMINEDGGVLLNIASGKCYSINRTAATIWAQLREPRSMREVQNDIGAKLQLSGAELESAISAFTQSLVVLGMVTAASTTSSATTSPVQRPPTNSFASAPRINRLGSRLISTPLALIAFVIAGIVLKLAGFQRLHQLVKRFPVIGRAACVEETTQKIVNDVDKAASWYFKHALCLQRSAVTACLLRLAGVSAEFVIGCRKVPFYSHAWVEVNGEVVNDVKKVQQLFATLDRC